MNSVCIRPITINVVQIKKKSASRIHSLFTHQTIGTSSQFTQASAAAENNRQEQESMERATIGAINTLLLQR
jgi:hypothetical protein